MAPDQNGTADISGLVAYPGLRWGGAGGLSEGPEQCCQCVDRMRRMGKDWHVAVADNGVDVVTCGGVNAEERPGASRQGPKRSRLLALTAPGRTTHTCSTVLRPAYEAVPYVRPVFLLLSLNIVRQRR